MNGTINFLVPIPIPISVFTVTVQTQDSWMAGLTQPVAVLLAVLIAGIINWWLQKRSFEAQNRINQENQDKAARLQRESFEQQNEVIRMNRRIDAYIEMLMKSPMLLSPDNSEPRIPFYLFSAASWGSTDIAAKASLVVAAYKSGNKDDYDKALREMILAIRDEIMDYAGKAKSNQEKGEL